MKRPINPASIRPPFALYSHAVEVPAGRMLFSTLGIPLTSPELQSPSIKGNSKVEPWAFTSD